MLFYILFLFSARSDHHFKFTVNNGAAPLFDLEGALTRIRDIVLTYYSNERQQSTKVETQRGSCIIHFSKHTALLLYTFRHFMHLSRTMHTGKQLPAQVVSPIVSMTDQHR